MACAASASRISDGEGGRARPKRAAALLQSEGAVKAFRMGWFALARDASLAGEWPALDGLPS